MNIKEKIEEALHKDRQKRKKQGNDRLSKCKYNY